MLIEVAIPCLNESGSVGKVIQDFRLALPDARIVIYDNGSTDDTAAITRAANAVVVPVARRGKGYVLQAIFEQSQADVVLLVDGDDTYDAADAACLVQPLLRGDADMTVGTRLESATAGEFRQWHWAGNRAITWMVNRLFDTDFHDVLSGYRAMTRRCLELLPLVASGFEVEVEMTIQSLELGFAVREVPIRYRSRSGGSVSKLRTFRDGCRIVLKILLLLRDYRPMVVFGVTAAGLAVVGTLLWSYGLLTAPALRPAGIVLDSVALAVFLAGVVLDTMNSRFRELRSLLRRRRPAMPGAGDTTRLLAASSTDRDES